MPSADRFIACLLLVAVVALTTVPTASGQAPGGGEGVVVVSTNLPEAVLYADSVRIGPVSDGAHHRLEAGARTLRLVAPSSVSWSVEPVERRVTIGATDTVTVDLRFPYHYAVTSVPFGASVYAETPGGRVALGETPLVHVQPEPLTGMLVVERPAYATERFAPGASVWNPVDAVLTPVAPAPSAAHEVAWEPPTQRLQWLDYASLAVAVGAGALAVHYKFKADRLYDRYAETTDPALRPDIKAYDTRSGVALGVMQGGIGLFAIRLVLRD